MARFLFFMLIVLTGLEAKEAIDVRRIVEEVVEPFMKQKQVSGVAVALFFEGQSYFFNFGFADKEQRKPVTQDTIFEIASITKVFTSTALAINVQAGRMQLNAPVTNYLPQIRKRNIPLNKVTLQHLATHSSSLPRTPEGRGNYGTPEGLMRYFEEWTPKWPLGSRYLYSNIGFGLLGYAISGADHAPFMQILEQTILMPLGMRHTFMVVPQGLRREEAQGYAQFNKRVPADPVNAWPGGGALRSTSRDMLAFLEANLGVKGPPALLQAMQFAQQGLYKVNDRLILGLGWQRYTDQGHTFIDKNGGLDGFSSYIGMLEGKGVVLLANKGKTQITETGRSLLARLNKKEEEKKREDVKPDSVD